MTRQYSTYVLNPCVLPRPGPERGQSSVSLEEELCPLLWAGLDPPVHNVCFCGSHPCPHNRECLWGRQWTLFIVSLLPEVAPGYSPHSSPPPGAWRAGRRHPRTRDVCRRRAVAGSPPRICGVPRCHRRWRKAGRPNARPPEDVLSVPPPWTPATGVLDPGALKPPMSAGLPDSLRGLL